MHTIEIQRYRYPSGEFWHIKRLTPEQERRASYDQAELVVDWLVRNGGYSQRDAMDLVAEMIRFDLKTVTTHERNTELTRRG